MKSDTQILIGIGFLLWVLSRHTPSSEVNVTMSSGGDETMQECTDVFGNPFTIPVSSGPCPTSTLHDMMVRNHG